MNRLLACLFLTPFLLFGNSVLSAQWSDDFESAQIGDTLDSRGYFLEYGVEQVSADGIGGSKGVKVETPFGAGWPRGWVYNLPCTMSVGDSLSLSVDAQMQNRQSVVNGQQAEMFEIEFQGGSSLLIAAMGRTNQGDNWGTYYPFIFESVSNGYFEGTGQPVSEVGWTTNAPGELSDFITLQLVVNKSGIDSYDVQCRILDLSGNVLNSVQSSGLALDAIFSGDVGIAFGHSGGATNTVLQNIRYDNFKYELNSPFTTVVPGSLAILRGNNVGGGLPELAASDNLDVVIQRAGNDIQARTEFEVKAISPVANPGSLEVTLEGSVFGRSTINQTIELFDYDAQVWEPIDTRVASRTGDNIVNVSVSGDAARFVEPGTLCMEARIRFLSVQPRQRFASNTDYFSWTIGQ